MFAQPIHYIGFTHMRKIFALTAAALLALVTLTGCQSTGGKNVGEGEWAKLAEKTVNFKSETDTVTPNPMFVNRNFSHIKLTCTQGTVDIKDITVNYTDGTSQKLDTLGILTKGSSTRAMKLNDDTKKVKNIEMQYSSLGNQTLNLAGITKKAKVEVMGKRSVTTNQ